MLDICLVYSHSVITKLITFTIMTEYNYKYMEDDIV